MELLDRLTLDFSFLGFSLSVLLLGEFLRLALLLDRFILVDDLLERASLSPSFLSLVELLDRRILSFPELLERLILDLEEASALLLLLEDASDFSFFLLFEEELLVRLSLGLLDLLPLEEELLDRWSVLGLFDLLPLDEELLDRASLVLLLVDPLRFFFLEEDDLLCDDDLSASVAVEAEDGGTSRIMADSV